VKTGLTPLMLSDVVHVEHVQISDKKDALFPHSSTHLSLKYFAVQFLFVLCWIIRKSSVKVVCVVFVDPENDTSLQNKLRLPAPLSAFSKQRPDVTTTNAAVGVDNVHSSLFAGILLIYSVIRFSL